MNAFLMSTWLFGGLLGGGADVGCVSDAQADRTMQEIRQQWPLRPSLDPVAVAVQDLGRRLTRTVDPQRQRRWEFAVVRNLEPSAFALGGGRFVVSDGLVAFVRSESELAAVLAHEIAHQQLDHFCRQAPRSAERIDLGGVTQHFDLKTELEADAKAVDLLTAAGFDPQAMAAVLRCLTQAPGGSSPQLAKRLNALRAIPAASTSRSQTDSPAFRRARESVQEDLGEWNGGETVCR
ncbi:peptidase M48-like protein [Thiobaca trueperi]|uniref:Peptidase M48-like protein n=2 Tax=Thiobaca trueperi TaxID=127458 RepID=A0A4R3N422_9GAMM|nr:peptidase M48-like protein [Thiobaca trueperi]